MTPNTPPTSTIEGMHIKDACFINDSSFLVGLTQNALYMFDLTKSKSDQVIFAGLKMKANLEHQG
jgi:hypothetical protein